MSPDDIVRYWKNAGLAKWLGKSRVFDDELRRRFLRLHEDAAAGRLRVVGDPTGGALALMILLDQFPRSAFAGSRACTPPTRSRGTTPIALCDPASTRSSMSPCGSSSTFRSHSEQLDDQDRSVELRERIGYSANARRHRDIIRRFGLPAPEPHFGVGRLLPKSKRSSMQAVLLDEQLGTCPSEEPELRWLGPIGRTAMITHCAANPSSAGLRPRVPVLPDGEAAERRNGGAALMAIREAEKGRINVGPRAKTRERDGKPLDLKILPMQCLAIYSASKHALEGCSESLDHELKPHGIDLDGHCSGPARDTGDLAGPDIAILAQNGAFHPAPRQQAAVRRVQRSAAFSRTNPHLTPTREYQGREDHPGRSRQSARANSSYPQRLKAWKRPALVIIDDVGLGQVRKSPDEPSAAHTLYNLIDRRQGQASTAISSNIKLSRWGRYLGDATAAAAILDRLAMHAIRIDIDGTSYRQHAGKDLTAKLAGNMGRHQPLMAPRR
jgi:uncharacterized protein (DUF924 family)